MTDPDRELCTIAELCTHPVVVGAAGRVLTPSGLRDALRRAYRHQRIMTPRHGAYGRREYLYRPIDVARTLSARPGQGKRS